ncbi:MAG: sulfate transporter, periplasmic sulfate-binding protein [Solirubrobacterales bacterium]|nr:sulfate transporter, periplasmic sulfate-binding protein [Solirubrobacterales bacterium]
MTPRNFIAALLALTALVVAGCGGTSDSTNGSDSGSSSSSGSTQLSLVAYSTPEVVYDEIIPDFQKTTAGKDVGFKTSYGASGEQSRAVVDGLKADYVSFSTEPDMTRLVDAGMVDKSWKDATTSKGLVTTSLVSFIVRKGNPKNIKSWDDLLKPGVEVITPNPFTSGAAKWNLLGAYAHGGDAYVAKLIGDHVKVQPKSGRDALTAFTGGQGDVLLSYEYEATTAQKKGEDVDYVIPDDTVKIDIDAATTTKAPAAAKAFLKYVLSAPAQQRFADWGYRPVNAAVLAKNKSKFPDPKTVKTIDDLGGWDKVDADLFDEATGSIAKIEEDAGVSTAK